MKKSKSLSKHLFNSLFLFFLMLGISNSVWAQTNGDYRTRADGDWNSNTTWQVYNGNWANCGTGDYPGASTPAGAVDISHNVTLPANISVTVRSLDIGSGNGNRLTVNGRLTVNTYMDMSTNGDFTLGDGAVVVVKGNFTGGNNTELSLSSYFFVYGDLSVRSVGQSDLDINTAHIYVFGDFTSQSTSFTRCDNYDGTTTSTTETCDAGTFESLINNTQNTDPVLESIIQQIIDDNTEDVNNLSSVASCICTGGSTTLTISENGTISLLKWYRGTTQLSNQANPSNYSYTANQAGDYNALYKIGSIWYQTNSITITSKQSPTALLSGTTIICSGNSTPITISFGGGGPWNFTYTDGTTPVTVSGQTTSPYILNVSPSSTKTYTLTNVNNGCCNGTTSGSAIITVNGPTTITSQSTAAQTRCLNGIFTSISVTAAGSGTLTYQWYRNTAATNSGGTSLASANGAQTASYTPQASSAGTLYYYSVVTGTCGIVTSTVSGAFVVNPTSVAGSTSSNQAICSGSSPSDIALTGNTGAIQWQSSTDNTTFNNITGATSATLTGAQMGTLSATRYYRAVVTSGVCSSATSNLVTITVNAATTIASQSTSAQTQCLNGTFDAISVTATGAGTFTYQWYSNTTAGNTGGTPISSATNASYTPLATSTGTSYYYCVVTGSCGTATSSVSGAFVVNPLVRTNKITMP